MRSKRSQRRRRKSLLKMLRPLAKTTFLTQRDREILCREIQKSQRPN